MLLWADGYGDWEEFIRSQELKDLVERANTVLARSAKGKGKGKKGKSS